jgi:Na+-driven multidrug efflux pump
VSIGTLAVVARLIGAGERRQAQHVARQALLVGLAAAGIGVGLSLALAPRFIAAMQLEGQTAALALRYIRIITPAIPLVMAEQVGTACLRGAGDTFTGLWARVALNIVNVLVSTAARRLSPAGVCSRRSAGTAWPSAPHAGTPRAGRSSCGGCCGAAGVCG